MPSLRYLILPIAIACCAIDSVEAQQTSRTSVSSAGVQSDRASNRPDISDDGMWVCYETQSTNVIPDDTNFVQDVYLVDLATGINQRISVATGGIQANGESKRPVISGNGKFVTFTSLASNFDTLDFNLTYDIFVRDLTSGTTTLVSRGLSTLSGNGLSTRPAINTDGNCIAFRSLASDLVAGDLNLIDDIFVYDRTLGTLQRVSTGPLGVEGNATSDRPTISGDGNLIAFWSDATNLVTSDLNLQRDIFMHDRSTGTTSLISVDSLGVQGNGPSTRPDFSSDGRFIVYSSLASNLVAGDTNAVKDIFVRDLLLGTTELISKNNAGEIGDDLSSVPRISADGRYVTYRSIASNLVEGDSNNAEDVFLHDRQTGVTTILSRSTSGNQGNAHSSRPAISADGQKTIFQSFATNLVDADTNLEEDVFLHEGTGWSGPPAFDSIFLTGPATALAGTSAEFNWSDAPPSSTYWLVYSFSLNGMNAFGHTFDIGAPYTVLANGVCTPTGTGTFTSPPLPQQAIGLTVYLELGALDANSVLSDSNAVAMTIL
ncbi:MAG: PD40 domain-containing protein [Planctomycetes bacterium]|nr:PD40 domain-containing protein [Planctomycetota bacterium]